MRRKPYTAIGIRRVPCARCGEKSHAQWNICADGNQPRGLCRQCDIELNSLVVNFVFGGKRADQLMITYRARGSARGRLE